MKPIKCDDHHWIIEGTTSGWIHGEKFVSRWKALIALKVFNKGGDKNEYRREVRQILNKRNSIIEVDVSGGDKSYYDIGYERAANYLPDIKRLGPAFWEEFRAYKYSNPKIEELLKARDELNIALGLGIGDNLKEAKARFLIITIELSELFTNTGSLERFSIIYPHVPSLANDIVRSTSKYLLWTPHHLEALYLQKAAYKYLKNIMAVSKLEQEIKQTQSLIRAGLISSSNVEKRHGAKVSGNKRPGIQLEELVEKLLHAMGLRATTTKATGDGGIDIIAVSDAPVYSGKYIIQCKDWTNPIGEPIIRDLFGVVISEGANKGILITTGKYTAAAEKFAERKQLELIDGETLNQLLKNHGLR